MAAARPGPGPRTRAGSEGELTHTEGGLVGNSVRALPDSDRSSEAISLLEDGVERACHDPALQLRLRHLLGAVLFYAGEYTRGAAVLRHRTRLQAILPAGRPERAGQCLSRRPRLRRDRQAGRPFPSCFYMQNADAAASADEARKVLETRFVIAQLLAADGYPEEALAELHAVRPLLADTFGTYSSRCAASRAGCPLEDPAVAAVRPQHPLLLRCPPQAQPGPRPGAP